MCFGPSKAEREASLLQRQEAEAAAAEEAKRTGKQKEKDISAALERRTARAGMRGGSGVRSLYRAEGGAGGFLGRFD